MVNQSFQKRIRRLATLAVGILALALVVQGCAKPTDDLTDPSLVGYFKSSYGDGFEISETTFTQYDDEAKAISFAGTIANGPDLTATEGILIIKITDGGTWGKSTGKYYAIRWKELTEAGVQESSAYKTGGDYNSGADTQSLAESEYTVANGYFGYYGQYVRQ